MTGRAKTALITATGTHTTTATHTTTGTRANTGTNDSADGTQDGADWPTVAAALTAAIGELRDRYAGRLFSSYVAHAEAGYAYRIQRALLDYQTGADVGM